MRASKRRAKELRAGDDITVARSVDPAGTIKLLTPEAAQVANWFNLGDTPRRRKARLKAQRRDRAPDPRDQIPLDPGTITLITGPSGAGKSSLLRALRESASDRVPIDLNAFEAPDLPIVNCFDGMQLLDALQLLARVGLGEAWTYLRTPSQLSEGQKFRLRLAIALHRASHQPAILICDEFAAMLDRLTAMVVARCLRRTIEAHSSVAALIATSHDDLVEALAPDVIVRCDFGRTNVTHT